MSPGRQSQWYGPRWDSNFEPTQQPSGHFSWSCSAKIDVVVWILVILNSGADVDSFMEENLHSLSVASFWRLGNAFVHTARSLVPCHEPVRYVRIQLLRCGSYHHGWMSSSAMKIERRPLRKCCYCLLRAGHSTNGHLLLPPGSPNERATQTQVDVETRKAGNCARR